MKIYTCKYKRGQISFVGNLLFVQRNCLRLKVSWSPYPKVPRSSDSLTANLQTLDKLDNRVESHHMRNFFKSDDLTLPRYSIFTILVFCDLNGHLKVIMGTLDKFDCVSGQNNGYLMLTNEIRQKILCIILALL